MSFTHCSKPACLLPSVINNHGSFLRVQRHSYLKRRSENKMIPLFLNWTSRGEEGIVMGPSLFKILIQVLEHLRAESHFIPSQILIKCWGDTQLVRLGSSFLASKAWFFFSLQVSWTKTINLPTFRKQLFVSNSDG